MDELQTVIGEFLEFLDDYCAKLDDYVERINNIKGDNN